jgi:hypothetical protein
MSDWPPEEVRLLDSNQETVETWDGFMVPAVVDIYPNVSARSRYVLSLACGAWIELVPGPLYDVIWDELERHARIEHDPERGGRA